MKPNDIKLQVISAHLSRGSVHRGLWYMVVVHIGPRKLVLDREQMGATQMENVDKQPLVDR